MAIWVHAFNVIIFNKFNKKVLLTSLPKRKTFQINKFLWILLKEQVLLYDSCLYNAQSVERKTEGIFKVAHVVNIKLAFTD